MTSRVPTSVVLDNLLRDAPQGTVTLSWLTDRLGDRSFGIILVFLAVLGLLPGVSAVAGILLLVPAFRMIMAHTGPVFPRRVSARHVDTRRLARMIRRIVPVLRYLERIVRPRWTTPFEATKRVVGAIVLLLGISLLAPIPFSNIPPACMIVLIAFAYLEEDGVLLAISLAATLVLFATVAVAIWQTLSATGVTSKSSEPVAALAVCRFGPFDA
jgi:hypothetical protein